MSQTDYWKKIEKEIKYSQGGLLYEDFTEALHQVYSRKLAIIEEILIDLSPEGDDPQYTETTSWVYEQELKELDAKQEKLEPIIKELIEKKENEDMLKDLGWTQEEYDAHLKLVEEGCKKRRLKRK